MIPITPHPLPRTARRGISAFLVILAWSCVAACMALALDTAMVFYQGRQLQTACESAALAGAAELLDPAALTPDGLTLWLATAGTQAYSFEHQRQLHVNAFEQAKQFAAANRAGGQPVELRLEGESPSQSDVVVGAVANPTGVHGGLVPTELLPNQRTNSLHVRASRSAERGNPVTLWFGQLLGLNGIDLTASARASLDHRVHGLRPAGHVRVPLVPVVVLADDDGSNDWMNQASQPCVPNQNDKIQVNQRTPAFSLGGDGIPEIQFAIPLHEQAEQSSHARLVSLGTMALPAPADLRRQLVEGYGAADMAACGGSLTIAGDAKSRMPIVPADEVNRTSLAALLPEILGEKRIWLFGTSTTDGRCRLTGFAAGQAIEVASDDQQLRITVQPCQLITSTARTGIAGPVNPWIGKLLRTQ